MKKLLFACLLVSIKTMAQNTTPGYATTSIESSMSWTDVDYVSDGITGHFLDVHLPKTGKAPYPVVVCIQARHCNQLFLLSARACNINSDNHCCGGADV